MINVNKLQNNAKFIVMILLISVISFMSAAIVGEVDARKNMSEYYCGIPNEGKIRCCATDRTPPNYDEWCTTCDNTTPPSNCTEAELQMRPADVESGDIDSQQAETTEAGKHITSKGNNIQVPLNNEGVSKNQ